MNKSHVFLGLVYLVTMCAEKTYGISCYECNSAQDKRCLGDLNNHLSEDLKRKCPDKKDKSYTLCRKIKQVIDFEVNGLSPDSRVIRTCGYENTQSPNRCYQRSGFGGRQEVCACQDDNCNTGAVFSLSTFLIVGFPLFFNIWMT